jgi:hypothetical protein
MNYDQSYTVVAPIATFQSTSTMQGSGSTYSSNPMLNAEGQATYTTQESSPAYSPGGPRRINTPGAGGTQQPLGDALIPLLLMVMAYATYLLLRRRKSRV